MNKAQLKLEIKKLAKELNLSFIDACKAMQSSAFKLGNEKMILIIHDIKMEAFNMEA